MNTLGKFLLQKCTAYQRHANNFPVDKVGVPAYNGPAIWFYLLLSMIAARFQERARSGELRPFSWASCGFPQSLFLDPFIQIGFVYPPSVANLHGWDSLRPNQSANVLHAKAKPGCHFGRV
jgi:hypothetical protein